MARSTEVGKQLALDMLFQGIIPVLFAATFATSPGPKAPQSQSHTGSEFVVEIVEKGVKKTSQFGFLVSMNGSIKAWVSQGAQKRLCRIAAQERREKTHIELHCDGDRAVELHAEASRNFTVGKRTKVAEVRRLSGTASQVFVTLR
ncbi:MAG: hypothetical protein ACPG77_13115 [Nannocystaceae bacterium]